MSPDALSASVNDIGSVIGMIDRIAGSAPVNGSRGALGEDLAAMTNTRDGMTGSRKMKCYTSAVPMNVLSSAGSGNDSFKRLICPETSDLESTATSSVKRLRIEVFILCILLQFCRFCTVIFADPTYLLYCTIC